MTFSTIESSEVLCHSREKKKRKRMCFVKKQFLRIGILGINEIYFSVY
jgi:hypothetical protein